MTAAVLVVDDSLTVRMDLKEAFAEAGLEAVVCGSVADARRAMAQARFSLIVLDVVLPDGDGVEFMREVRASPGGEGLRVMMLSTEAEVQDRIRGLATGADEYVGKPYDREWVVARARELVAALADGGEPGRPRVLVIDDSATYRRHIRAALEAEGYATLEAATGEEGLRVAAASRPDAVLVDRMLPGIDGPAVVRRIRLDAALRDTPCLLLTASDGAGVEVGALDAGADGFIRKEADPKMVLAHLGAVLRHAGARVAATSPASLLGPKKVLAVDDSPTYLAALAGAMREDGYEVILARSGEEALEMLAVQPVDCVLLDLVMPGLSGQDTCRRVKAAPGVRDIPVLMLTALEDRDAMIDGLGAGADDYIAKSSGFDVLRARVRAQLRRRQFEDENRRILDQLLRKELEAAEARAARDLAELRAAYLEDVEQKNQELEAFSYSVSHDLRAPLRSIEGFSRALEQDHTGGLDETGRDYLSRIRRASHRMSELIEALLQLSRVGRAALRRESVDLSAIAAAVLADLRRADPGRTVEVSVQEGLVVEGDARLLRAVLENLLGNAWKFTARRDPGRIEFGTLRAAPETCYFVRDDGVGFDMAFAERLFTPFHRLHGDVEFPGSGVGLATVRRIVHRHGGRVWAEAAPGQGATFFFTIVGSNSGGWP